MLIIMAKLVNDPKTNFKSVAVGVVKATRDATDWTKHQPLCLTATPELCTTVSLQAVCNSSVENRTLLQVQSHQPTQIILDATMALD